MAQGSPWGPVGHLQAPPPWRTPSCISEERGRKEGEEVRGGRVRRKEETEREGNEEEEEEMERSEKGGKEGQRQQGTIRQRGPAQANAVKETQSETDRRTDKSQRDGTETENKSKCVFNRSRGRREEETWEITALGMGEASSSPPTLEATGPHLPTAQLPARQPPA